MTLHPDWLDWPETKALVKAFAGKSELRFVGGAVRDAVLAKSVQDVDAATTLLPEATMVLLQNAGIKAIPTGIEHGTVTAVIGQRSFEITTLRKDIATDGRHAVVAYSDDWKEDAARRDFTMNALYLSPAGELFDYFGGEQDAKTGQVKFIGEAAARISEDYLRILRFFRFYAWYGKGAADVKALAACAENAKHIAELSGERIRTEMLKLLSAPRVFSTLELMRGEILRHTFGFPIHNINVMSELEKIETMLLSKPDPLVRLALLLPSIASLGHIKEKWRLSGDVHKKLQLWLKSLPQMKADMDVSVQKKMLRALGTEMFIPLVLMRWAQEPETRWQNMLTLAKEWWIPEFPVSGKDLLQKGFAEGKEMGEALRRLEEEWEQSDYTLSKEQLLAKV